MVLDATKTRRGPLTKAEKERRVQEGLCHYCASDKHKLLDCPLRQRNTLNTVTVSNPQDGIEYELHAGSEN